MSTPALRTLRETAQGARIVAVARPGVCRLLRGLHDVDEFLPYDRAGMHRGLRGLFSFAGSLRERRASLGVLLPHSLSSAIQFRLAGIRRLAGFYTRQRALLLSHAPRPLSSHGRRIPEPMPAHYLKLLGSLGAASEDHSLRLVVLPEEEQGAAEALLDLGLGPEEPYFAVNPGAAFGPSKLWTVEGFGDTIRGLHRRHGIRTLVLSGPGEEALARDVAGAAGPAALCVANRVLPLEQLKPVLRDARLLVTTDTGPRHIATAFSVPTVVLMGPTDPRYTASNLERTRVLRVDVDCGPCHLKTCPLDRRCMTRLTAGDALEAAADLLNRFSTDRRECTHA